jgi:hypothetical protein
VKDFLRGFLQGAKETPLAYFAPAIALWRLFVTTADSLIEKQRAKPEQR